MPAASVEASSARTWGYNDRDPCGPRSRSNWGTRFFVVQLATVQLTERRTRCGLEVTFPWGSVLLQAGPPQRPAAVHLPRHRRIWTQSPDYGPPRTAEEA